VKALDELAAEATEVKARLRLDSDALTRAAEMTVDGLFYTPLLALTILVIARAKKPGLLTKDMATWTLGTLVKHFEALRLARGRIQWSVLLRRRCADALVFLEDAALAGVQEIPDRTIHLTVQGREFIGRVSRGSDEVAVLVRQLERAYRAVDQGGLELL
jgi:hypothetical protein